MSDDLHSLSGAYALDALDDDERADFEEHLARCATCRPPDWTASPPGAVSSWWARPRIWPPR